MDMCENAPTRVGRSENNCEGLFLSHHDVGLRMEIDVISLGRKHLYSPSLLIGSIPECWDARYVWSWYQESNPELCTS